MEEFTGCLVLFFLKLVLYHGLNISNFKLPSFTFSHVSVQSRNEGLGNRWEKIFPNPKGTLTKFNIEAQLFSLLSDTELMSPANLLFGEDPFSDIDESDFLGDMDTSKWRRLTKVKICVGGKDILCPIIGFIDETFIDTKGNLTLESVSFTLWNF